MVKFTSKKHKGGTSMKENSSTQNGSANNNVAVDGTDENGSSYHINFINKKKFILYEQRDSRWNDLSFKGSDGIGTVGDRGCNIISTAVILSSYDSSITPYSVYYSGYKNSHPYDAINNLTNNTYSCSMTSTSKSDIVDYLKKGYVAVILVYGSGNQNGGSSKFTSIQHYMALIDISSDGSKIFVGNSYGNSVYTYGKTGWFDTDEVLTSVIQVHMCDVSK